MNFRSSFRKRGSVEANMPRMYRHRVDVRAGFNRTTDALKRQADSTMVTTCVTRMHAMSVSVVPELCERSCVVHVSLVKTQSVPVMVGARAVPTLMREHVS